MRILSYPSGGVVSLILPLLLLHLLSLASPPHLFCFFLGVEGRRQSPQPKSNQKTLTSQEGEGDDIVTYGGEIPRAGEREKKRFSADVASVLRSERKAERGRQNSSLALSEFMPLSVSEGLGGSPLASRVAQILRAGESDVSPTLVSARSGGRADFGDNSKEKSTPASAPLPIRGVEGEVGSAGIFDELKKTAASGDGHLVKPGKSERDPRGQTRSFTIHSLATLLSGNHSLPSMDTDTLEQPSDSEGKGLTGREENGGPGDTSSSSSSSTERKGPLPLPLSLASRLAALLRRQTPAYRSSRLSGGAGHPPPFSPKGAGAGEGARDGNLGGRGSVGGGSNLASTVSAATPSVQEKRTEENKEGSTTEGVPSFSFSLSGLWKSLTSHWPLGGGVMQNKEVSEADREREANGDQSDDAAPPSRGDRNSSPSSSSSSSPRGSSVQQEEGEFGSAERERKSEGSLSLPLRVAEVLRERDERERGREEGDRKEGNLIGDPKGEGDSGSGKGPTRIRAGGYEDGGRGDPSQQANRQKLGSVEADSLVTRQGKQEGEALGVAALLRSELKTEEEERAGASSHQVGTPDTDTETETAEQAKANSRRNEGGEVMMGTSGLDDRAEASGRGRGSAAPPPPPVGVDISLLPDAAPSSSLSNSRSGVGTGEGQWEGTGGGKERGARGQRGQRAEKKETPLRLAALAEILRNSLSSSDAGVISSLVAEGEAARERGRGEEKRGKILAKSGLSELGRSSDSPAAAGGGGGGGSGMASSPSRMTTEGAEEAESKVWRRKGLLDVPLVVWAVILDAFAIIFCFSVGTLIIVVPRNCEAAASSSGKGEGCCPCPCCSDRCCCIPPGKAPTRQELLSPRKGHTNQHSKNKNPVGPEGGSPLPGGIQIPMRSPPLPPSPGLGGGGGARPLSPFSPLSLQRDNRLSPQRWNLQEGRGGGFTAQLTEAERRRAEREQEEPSSD